MSENKRILIVDDNKSIHEDFRKILSGFDTREKKLDNLEESLFGKTSRQTIKESFFYQLDDAFSGEEAIQMIAKAQKEERPYALAFVDERMPPGLDGLETILQAWEVDPELEMVICTAYSDYSWDNIVSKCGSTDHLLILKKPFDSVEVKQIALALTSKWSLAKKTKDFEAELESKVKKQTFIISSLFEFANRLHCLKSLDEVLNCILETVADFTNSQRISIMLPDEAEQYLIIKKSIGLPESITPYRIKIGEGIAGRVFESGQKLVINNIKENFAQKYSEYDAFISAPFICVPLVGNEIKLGVLNITNKIGNLPFTKEEEEIISYISYTATIAINNQISELKMENTFLGTLKALAAAIEIKDPYTKGHSERVATIAENIAKELNLTSEQINLIHLAGILHDIGKIGIPENVLGKPGKLSSEEYELVKKHPVFAENILKDITFLDKAREIIKHHHERIDGSGYPDGLKENELSLEVNILAVADTFDAMNTDRPYRKAIPPDVIRKELLRLRDKKLNGNCIDALLRYLKTNSDKSLDY